MYNSKASIKNIKTRVKIKLISKLLMIHMSKEQLQSLRVKDEAFNCLLRLLCNSYLYDCIQIGSDVYP
jgi:hypothetical protein